MVAILSVIIPCYNVDKYIISCLDSIYSKGFDEDEFEVILVDDESPDQVVLVASEYLKDKKNYTIVRQKNKGLGGARNTGMQKAVGKFILFLDADDVLVMRDYAFLKKCTAQIIQLSSANITVDGKISSAFHAPDVNEITGKEFWLNYTVMPSACNKLYRKSFIKEYNLEFKNHIYSEDIEFNARAFFFAKRVTSKNVLVQHFLQSPNSITRNRNLESRKKLFADLTKITELLILFKNTHSKKAEDDKYFNKIISDIGLGILNLGIRNQIEISEIYRLRRYLVDNKIPIFKIKYDNKNKNIFKRILQIPFSILILKTVFQR